MSFGAQDLRPGKDVFSVEGTYLGTVIWVATKPFNSLPHSHGGEGESGEGSSPPAFSGEAIGPMPTAHLGNTGPSRQSPATDYAAAPDGTPLPRTRSPTELVVLRLLTSLNWSTLRPRLLRVPVSLVQAVSHERIVLAPSSDAAAVG